MYGELCKKAKVIVYICNNTYIRKRYIIIHVLLSYTQEEIRIGLSNKAKSREMVRTSSMSEIPNATKAYELQIDRFEQKKLFDLKVSEVMCSIVVKYL